MLFVRNLFSGVDLELHTSRMFFIGYWFVVDTSQ